jgi:hypothetical protein
MVDEVRVDPAVLRSRAGACGDLNAKLTGDETGIEGATQAAAAGLPGWWTKGALEQLLWSWRDDLAKLGRYLDNFGAALEACARDYEHGDRANADNFDFRYR